MSQNLVKLQPLVTYGRCPRRQFSCACIRANTRPTGLYTVVHTIPQPAKRILLINDEFTLRRNGHPLATLVVTQSVAGIKNHLKGEGLK
jgi:hypothetical protein